VNLLVCEILAGLAVTTVGFCWWQDRRARALRQMAEESPSKVLEAIRPLDAVVWVEPL